MASEQNQPEGSEPVSDEATQFYREIHNVIRRWQREGDTLSLFEITGALEAVQCDVMDTLAKHNRKGNSNERPERPEPEN